jgi:radical SAM protein with 4Fe4S-binding SPASM domain
MEQKWVMHAVKEIRSLRSFSDVKNLNRKLIFLLGRLKGDFTKGTKVPPVLQIEPTNKCNLSCICCSGHSNSRKKGDMDFKLFCRIIDESADIGVKRIHLYLHGEPLLHPQVGEMVRHIKSRDLALTLATNGMHLTRKKIADVMKSGMTSADYLLLSVLGFSKETHEKVMRGVIHEQVVGNIANLLEYRRNNGLKGPIIETVFYIMPENRDEEKKYYEYWRKVVDNARVVRSAEQYSAYRNNAYQAPVRAKTCNQLWERMTVQWNGNAVLCHADIDGNHVLGNLKERSITELWNGELISRVRNLHRESKFKEHALCRACDW